MQKLSNYLIDNKIDVAQLQACLKEYSSQILITHDSEQLWAHHLLKEAIDNFVDAIDLKK